MARGTFTTKTANSRATCHRPTGRTRGGGCMQGRKRNARPHPPEAGRSIARLPSALIPHTGAPPPVRRRPGAPPATGASFLAIHGTDPGNTHHLLAGSGNSLINPAPAHAYTSCMDRSRAGRAISFLSGRLHCVQFRKVYISVAT